MDLRQVEDLLEVHEKGAGNASAMFLLLQDRLIGLYTEEDLFGAAEFLFFEDRYLLGMKHMIENNIHGNILDIGSQFGFQSEIFLDEKSYTGIEKHAYHYFNENIENVSYVTGSFPIKTSIEFQNYDVVFSVMSLGYFNKQIHEDEEMALDILVETLSTCKHLYIATTQRLIQRLKEIYPIQTLITSSVHEGSRLIKADRFDFYYFSQGGIV
jgi:hypothetical protein